MDQNDPPQFNHPISASYGSSSGGNLADVLSGGHAPHTKHLSMQTGDFYFGTFGENSSGTHSMSRDTFYRYKSAVEDGGVEALFERTRRKPNLANRVDQATEDAVIKSATDFPAYGQARTSNELRKLGVFVSPSGVRSIWLRHDLVCAFSGLWHGYGYPDRRWATCRNWCRPKLHDAVDVEPHHWHGCRGIAR